MAAAAVVDDVVPSDQPPTEALKELLSDCTCPICQEVYTNPHQLSCGHTFCLGCFDKLKRKWQKSSSNSGGGNGIGDRLMRLHEMMSMSMRRSSGGGNSSSNNNNPLLCPVCRSSIDPHKPVTPDQTARALLTALKAVKAGCCKQADCWRQARVCCTDCDCGLCDEHHRARLDALRSGCVGLAEDAERYLLAKAGEAGRIGSQLAEAEGQLAELERALSEAVRDRMGRCRGQLSQARLDWALESRELSLETEALSAGVSQLRQLLNNGPDAALVVGDLQTTRHRQQLERRLRAARARFPPSGLQLGFEPDKLAADHATLLSGVSARLLKRPYGGGGCGGDIGQLKPSLVRRTKRAEPWEVRLMDGGRLLVNYKGFPTRRLHVFSVDSLAETGTVELQITQAQFPGQTCVCNRRGRILASDPKNHCVYEFDFQGRVTAQFGSKGSEPGQLHSPKGMYAHEGILYVVDSKNKRVQLFDMDRSYECLGSLEHESLGANIQAVLAGAECVVVCDRSSDTLVVFDRTSRRFLRQLPAGGEPFDACADQFDNLIVSLTRERKVKVFDPSVTQCINTFEVGAGQGSMGDSKSLKNYLHGVAFDQANSRLFLAEAFAKRLLGFDM